MCHVLLRIWNTTDVEYIILLLIALLAELLISCSNFLKFVNSSLGFEQHKSRIRMMISARCVSEEGWDYRITIVMRILLDPLECRELALLLSLSTLTTLG